MQTIFKYISQHGAWAFLFMAAISTSLLGPLNQFSLYRSSAGSSFEHFCSKKNNQHQFSYNFFTRCVFREHYSGRSRRYFQAMATAGIFHSPPLDSQPSGFIKAIGYIPHPSL